MKYVIKESTKERIDKAFVYHPSNRCQMGRYHAIRDVMRSAALVVAENSPDSREQSIALERLEGAMFFANAAIARGESKKDVVTILVNGNKHEVFGPSIGYSDIVGISLYCGSVVKYSDAASGLSGTLIDGVSVRICNGTKFSVTPKQW